MTDARLWETQRGDWSIKGIICQRAFWDRDGKESTVYWEGEFERIYAEKPRITLHYPGGLSTTDWLALPLIVERLQRKHPGCNLQIRSVQNDGGGASVTITVEDLVHRGVEESKAEVEVLRGEFLAIQLRLRNEENLRLAFETKYKAMVEDFLPMLLDKLSSKHLISIGQLTAPFTVEGPTMSRDTYNISGQAGGVGPGTHAHDMTFQQLQAGTDLSKLAQNLGLLRNAMKGEATGTREQDKAIGAVADAEEAASKGDGSATLRFLKGAGKWGLEVAEKIGAEVAVDALKKVM